jgi:hypothetical protein
MHTSTQMSAGDFQYACRSARGLTPVDFATFAPDYHALDRVGVVSLTLEAGVQGASHALLALTTAFYDQLRAQPGDFFDYPQHFALVGASADGIQTQQGVLPRATPDLWEGWSWLDVWPDAKWVTAPATPAGMLQRVLDYQINRLFWPRTLLDGAQAEPDTVQLPAYLWKMLKTRLKTVYLYGEGASALPMQAAPDAMEIEIQVTPAVAEVVQESWTRLPASSPDTLPAAHTPQCYTPIAVADFLQRLQPAPA